MAEYVLGGRPWLASDSQTKDLSVSFKLLPNTCLKKGTNNMDSDSLYFE